MCATGWNAQPRVCVREAGLLQVKVHELLWDRGREAAQHFQQLRQLRRLVHFPY